MTEKKPPFPSQVADRFVIRLPDGMRKALADRAARNNRSMNAEVLFILDAYFSGALVPAEQLLSDPAVRKLIATAVGMSKPQRKRSA